MELDTMQNLSGLSGTQCHIVPLPQMCPVSGNPQAGSYIAVRYVDSGLFLEVYAIERYLLHYVGGWMRDGLHIRDMEQTIDTIAKDCARAVKVPVTVRARLILDCGQMIRTVKAQP